MAHVIADRVADTATTTGTGAFTVSGSAPTGFRTLSTVLSTSDTFYYVIAHQSANEWEVGLGTHSGGNVFARTTPIASSNGGSAVDFSAGTKEAGMVQPAARDNPRLSGLTDNTLARYDGTLGNLQGSGILVDDTTNDVSGLGNVVLTAGSGLRSGTTATNTLLLQARDVDGSAWTTALRLTSGDTPTFELVSLDLEANGRSITELASVGLFDSNSTHSLLLKTTSNLTANRDFTIVPGDAARTLTMGGDVSIDGNAVAASQETATSTTLFVTPAVQQRHPSGCKAWHRITYSAGTPTAAESYNVTSLTDTGTGDARVNLTVAFGAATYCAVAATINTNNLGSTNIVSASVYDVFAIQRTDGALIDSNTAGCSFGDQ